MIVPRDLFFYQYLCIILYDHEEWPFMTCFSEDNGPDADNSYTNVKRRSTVFHQCKIKVRFEKMFFKIRQSIKKSLCKLKYCFIK